MLDSEKKIPSRMIAILNTCVFRIMKKAGCSLTEARQMVVSEFRVNHWEDLFDEYRSFNWDKWFTTKYPNEDKNLKFLAGLGVDHAALWPTPVGLRKSIFDATAPIRQLLKDEKIHDYEEQAQGPENKILKETFLVGNTIKKTKTSLYRPVTKHGDPRFWVYSLGDFCEPGDQLALAVREGLIYVFNLSKYDYQELIEKGAFSVEMKSLWFLSTSGPLTATADELMKKMKSLVGIPLYAPNSVASLSEDAKQNEKRKRDTDVGMAIEHALGVPPNSEKKPDYKGIELKAWRETHIGKTENRHTLFTCVPDFCLSPLKSMKAFVDLTGYPLRGEKATSGLAPANAKELHCTTSSIAPNSQGLQLRVDLEKDVVVEWLPEKQMDLLLWAGSRLRLTLQKKHPETFWIECETYRDKRGVEFFLVKRIIYTRGPLIAQFLSLIEQGKVTLDHMCTWRIKKGDSKMGFSERGPAFKIHSADLPYLFPNPKAFDLTSHK